MIKNTVISKQVTYHPSYIKGNAKKSVRKIEVETEMIKIVFILKRIFYHDCSYCYSRPIVICNVSTWWYTSPEVLNKPNDIWKIAKPGLLGEANCIWLKFIFLGDLLHFFCFHFPVTSFNLYFLSTLLMHISVSRNRDLHAKRPDANKKDKSFWCYLHWVNTSWN